MQYAPTTGDVRSFEIPMQFSNWIRAALQKIVPFSSPSGPRGGAYLICPYDRVRVPLQNTDAMPRPGTYYPSKNCPVSIPFGAVCGAYSIRPYDRIHVILRNTDVIPQPGTCEGSKNGSVYATDGGVWWGVFNMPLQSGTYDPLKYRCNTPTGYVQSYEIPM